MSTPNAWRCWFCDEVFTTQGSARDHFGVTQFDKPGCLIDYQVALEEGGKPERGRGLLMALRKADAELARYREEDTDLHRALHAKDGERNTAVMRAEEKGYARGLRDGVNLPADSPERAALTCGVHVGCPRHGRVGRVQGCSDCFRLNPDPHPNAHGVTVDRPLGCALAMRVMQSDMYRQLDDAERADCDELVQQNLEWFKRDSAAGVGAVGPTLLQQAYDAGWVTCAGWANRLDLVTDCDSRAYDTDRAKALTKLPGGADALAPLSEDRVRNLWEQAACDSDFVMLFARSIESAVKENDRG